MATFTRRDGKWRAQVRRGGQSHSRTFRLKADAEAWAREAEDAIRRGKTPNAPHILLSTTLGNLIDLHIQDMLEVGKSPRRSKTYTLERLNATIGHLPLTRITRGELIDYAKWRRAEGAGPVTIGMEIGYLKTILTHAAAVHGLEVPTEEVTLARVALRRLGLVGKGNERDRRPTQDELDRIIAHKQHDVRQIIPLGRIVKFAVATAMRQEEISRVCWSDFDSRRRVIVVRDRKDPRRTTGNHQTVPLVDTNGYDPIALMEEQRAITPWSDRVFPYNGRSVGHAFRRACRELDIKDLRFHDLRHEATSRLFEAGFDIPEVALVTGHRDWKMLQRYLNLQPHQLLQRKPTPRRY